MTDRVLQRRSVPAVQAWLNDRMVWLLRVEQRRGIPWGLSLLAVARRQEAGGGDATGTEKNDG